MLHEEQKPLTVDQVWTVLMRIMGRMTRVSMMHPGHPAVRFACQLCASTAYAHGTRTLVCADGVIQISQGAYRIIRRRDNLSTV